MSRLRLLERPLERVHILIDTVACRRRDSTIHASGGKQRHYPSFLQYLSTKRSTNFTSQEDIVSNLKSFHLYRVICRVSEKKWNSLPTTDSRIKMQAPNSIGRRLPIFVTAIVCTFSVRVEAPAPVPQKPASMLVNPSKPMLRLTTPGVGALEATKRDVAWYAPTCNTSTQTASKC